MKISYHDLVSVFSDRLTLTDIDLQPQSLKLSPAILVILRFQSHLHYTPSKFLTTPHFRAQNITTTAWGP